MMCVKPMFPDFNGTFFDKVSRLANRPREVEEWPNILSLEIKHISSMI